MKDAPFAEKLKKAQIVMKNVSAFGPFTDSVQRFLEII